MRMRLFARVLAEFIGTFAVVLIGAGAMLRRRRVARHGLARPGSAWESPLRKAWRMPLMISAAGPVSGGHLNPAISIGFWVTRRLGTFDLILYRSGAASGRNRCGASADVADCRRACGARFRWGRLSRGHDLTRTPAMGMEAVLTFFLVFVFFLATARAGIEFPHCGRNRHWTYGVHLLSFSADPFTGAAMNPARVLGPAWFPIIGPTTASIGSARCWAELWPPGSATASSFPTPISLVCSGAIRRARFIAACIQTC